MQWTTQYSANLLLSNYSIEHSSNTTLAPGVKKGKPKHTCSGFLSTLASLVPSSTDEGSQNARKSSQVWVQLCNIRLPAASLIPSQSNIFYIFCITLILI